MTGIKKVWILTGLVAAAFAAAYLMVGGHHGPSSQTDRPAPHDENGPGTSARTAGDGMLPWGIEVMRDGSSIVMGLTLSDQGHASTLQQVRDQWGEAVQVAIVAAPGEVGTLEAFVDPAGAGYIQGKAVVTARLPDDRIKAMRERAAKSEFMESATRKFLLAPEDLAAAMQAPVAALSFIPQASLDETAIVGRFGEPAERIKGHGTVTHLLYPGKGLDIALDSKGKELFQYVAPSVFDERLRAPLRGASSP